MTPSDSENRADAIPEPSHARAKPEDFECPILCDSCEEWFDDSEQVAARDLDTGELLWICERCAEAHGVL